MGQKKSQAREKTRIEEGLATYGLDSPAALGNAIGVSRQHAYQILTGRWHRRPFRIGVKVAKRIAAATGLPWTLILEWQDGNSH